MYPVRKNLIRAEKLLRNMSLATEIQTAIALIRRHKQATQQAVRSFVQAKAELQQTNPNGKTENVLRYGPGSILDVPANQEYDVPKQLDPSKTISALQAELRAIASHLVMPEFMLSSDASNANYASTMVAEGPAVKNFEAEQQVQIEYDLELLDEAMRYAVDSSLLSRAEWEACKIDVQPPTVQVRDRLQEAQIRQIDMGLGILSPQTATAQAGNDYEQEQTNRELHEERTGGVPGFSFSGQSQSTESHDVALENCGIGPNGFTSGNTCAKGGGSVGRSSKASKRKKTKKKKKRNKRLTISQAANALSAKGYTLLAPDPWTPETGVVYNIVDPSGKKIKVKAADVADLID